MKTVKAMAVALAAACGAAGVAEGAVRLPAVMGDGAVLMRSARTAVWGTETPGGEVEVEVAGVRAKATAGTNGVFTAYLDLTKAGEGPHEMTVRGKDSEAKARDVLVGEVWLSSGQSNMELPFCGMWGTVEGYEKLRKETAGREIRFFKARMTWAQERREWDTGGKWVKATEDTLKDFSAVAYSFINEIQKAKGGPAAIIDLAVGGTSLAQWTSHEAFAGDAVLTKEFAEQTEWARNKAEFGAWRARNGARSGADMVKLREDGSGWESGARLPEKPLRGAELYRRRVKLTKGMKERSGPMTQFFVEGIETDLAAVAMFGKIGKGGAWGAESDLAESGVAKRLSRRKNELVEDDGETVELALRIESVADGARIRYDRLRFVMWDAEGYRMELPLEGWERKVESAYPEPKEAFAAKPFSKLTHMRHEHMFNCLFYPMRRATVKGIIFYQGCSDSRPGAETRYVEQLKMMVGDWRARMGKRAEEMPFYYCQLAGYGLPARKPGETSGQTGVREAQRVAWREIPNSSCAIIYDLGETECHGRIKVPAGERLARIALARDYGVKGLVYRAPDFAGVSESGGKLTVKFERWGSSLKAREVAKEYGGGVGSAAPHKYERKSPGSELEGFAVCGADGKWHWADARVAGPDTVEVWSAGVAKPVAVRYNMGGLDRGNLGDDAGLVVSGFEGIVNRQPK